MTWSFITHITNYLGRPGLDEQKAPTLWPSEATAVVTNEHGENVVLGKCRRANYFRYVNDMYNFSEDYADYEELVKEIKSCTSESDIYLRWIWKQGEIYEQYCVDLAKESGVFISGQTSIYVPKLNISGKIDLIVVNPDTHKFHIVEVKSVYGFNANKVLGSPGERKKGGMGEPRDSHLMQIGIYQWWYGNTNDHFGEGLLVYGSRDTGRFAEYKITVETCEDSLDYIFYQPHSPYEGEKVNSGITIQSVCNNYKYVKELVEKRESPIPDRDFELQYSDERLLKMYQRGELNKTETTQFEKRQAQIAEGKEKLNKQVEKGDWQCALCQYRLYCYTEEGQPKR